MKLNDGFEVVRGSILLMKPLPVISHAYRLLMQVEKHRQLCKENKENAISITDEANNTCCEQRKVSGQMKQHTLHAVSSMQRCYKLHGFPPHFKFDKNKMVAAMKMNSKNSGGSSNIKSANVVVFSNFVAYVENQFDLRAKYVRIDNAQELIEGYKVLNMDTLTVHTSRDVMFKEQHFPFHISSSHASSPLPFFLPIVTDFTPFLDDNLPEVFTPEFPFTPPRIPCSSSHSCHLSPSTSNLSSPSFFSSTLDTSDIFDDPATSKTISDLK
uniref:Uncharacterized protein n=1 Tax=Chenopodium quinoa TaxID=63459 RepID=A0A803ND31_CHEQI